MGRIHTLAERGGDLGLYLASEGFVYVASDADQDDKVTGQTSFAATTPTFMIDVPTGVTVVPLMVSLGQSGTVGGGAVSCVIEIDNADRYGNGGTAETVLCTRTSGGQALPSGVAVYSGATANAGYGARVFGVTVAADVEPAEGISNEILWTPTSTPEFLVGPAAFLVYTWAASTGPTWFWSIKFAAFPTDEYLT